MDRSYLLLAAAVLLGGLVLVQAFRGGEPAPLPVSGPAQNTGVDALPSSDVAAAPVDLGDGAAVLQSIRVEGLVTNPRGDRLSGVRIAVSGAQAEESATDATGAYQLRLDAREGEVPTLHFSAGGYQDGVAQLEAARTSGGQVRLDVRLEPAPGAVVAGTLTTERGSPIPGEAIQLQSPGSNARRVGVTGVDGRFYIPGVAPAPAYYLFVRPKAAYGDYQRRVEVGEDGLSLDIALRELSTTRLTGRLVDTAGRAIPDLEVSVVSGQALGRSLTVRTDADGRFAVDAAPTGHLSFVTNAPDKLLIGGVLLRPGSDADVQIRADWGDGALRGRVVGEGGRPLGGAEVELSWSYVGEEGFLSARSNRSVVTDASGAFEFRRLGDGVHRLDVRAPGHGEVQLDYEVAPESPGLEVQLEPRREAG